MRRAVSQGASGLLTLSLLALLFGEEALLAIEASGVPEPVSFRNEVMAVLSKAACNAGTCHGNKNGKGGFKLSLRGQDPAAEQLLDCQSQVTKVSLRFAGYPVGRRAAQ